MIWSVYFPPITLLLILLQWHTWVYEGMFDANITRQNNIWKFIIGKSSLQEMVNFVIIREICYSNLETGIFGLKSPGFNPGVVSTAWRWSITCCMRWISVTLGVKNFFLDVRNHALFSSAKQATFNSHMT